MIMRRRPPRFSTIFLPIILLIPRLIISFATVFFLSFAWMEFSIFSAKSGTASKMVGETSLMFSGMVRRFSTMLLSHMQVRGTRKLAVNAKTWCRGNTSRKLSHW